MESVGGAHTRGTCSFTLRRSAVAGVERESSLGFAPTMLSPPPPLECVFLPHTEDREKKREGEREREGEHDLFPGRYIPGRI